MAACGSWPSATSQPAKSFAMTIACTTAAKKTPLQLWREKMPGLHVFRGGVAASQAIGAQTGQGRSRCKKEKSKARRRQKESGAAWLSGFEIRAIRKNIREEAVAAEVFASLAADKIHGSTQAREKSSQKVIFTAQQSQQTRAEQWKQIPPFGESAAAS